MKCDYCDGDVTLDVNGFWVGADQTSDCPAGDEGHDVIAYHQSAAYADDLATAATSSSNESVASVAFSTLISIAASDEATPSVGRARAILRNAMRLQDDLS